MTARAQNGQFAKAEEMTAVPTKELDQIRDTIGFLQTENFKMQESLQNIDMMVDAKGWHSAWEYGRDGGLSLSQIKEISAQLRELMIANPFMKRGSQLRVTYVWGGGVEFGCSLRSTGKSQKFTVAMQAIMRHPKNLRNLFSDQAQESLERAAFGDGGIYALGDNATKTIQLIPLKEITGDLRNPDDSSEIWAYRREWFKNPNDTAAESTVRWYYTDTFEGTKKTRIVHDNKLEIIDTAKTIIDQQFSSQVGWAYGVPDGLAALAWVKLYKEFLVNGFIMSKALANFAFKATMGSQKTAQKASLSMAKENQAGSAVISGDDFAPLATAGKGYDFNSGRPLAAAIAAGLEVSLVALLSDPGAAGGSYGTAQTLDAPAKATAALRRRAWNDFWERIFRFFGLVGTQDLEVIWHNLDEEATQRVLQAITLAHNTGLFDGTIIQALIAEALEIRDPGTIPAGYRPLNNVDSIAAKTADAGTSGASGSTDGSGQGQNTPAGTGANDHSTDDNAE